LTNLTAKAKPCITLAKAGSWLQDLKRGQTMLRLFLALMLLAVPARADTALAAVAANFAGAAEALVAAYQAQSGHEITLTTGATGKLYAQITQGAPFDLFLSADAATPALLHAEGHGAPVPYAIGQLVLWAPRGSGDPVAFLTSATTRHIAIANPDLAPYGLAAREALTALGLWDRLSAKIVMGQNIGQAHSLVASGAAEAGFVAASGLAAGSPGLVWPIPETDHAPIRQDAQVLRHGAANPAATGFLAYLSTPEARAIIQTFGYRVASP
jgi:molybdate transport system substrate-binding protein